MLELGIFECESGLEPEAQNWRCSDMFASGRVDVYHLVGAQGRTATLALARYWYVDSLPYDGSML